VLVRGLVADEGGFTLTELLVAMSIGMIVLFASMQVFINGVHSSARVTDRAEAAQRGRLAMDRITTVLDAQTCVGSTAPIQPAASGNQLRFTADLGDQTFSPRLYELRYDAATDRIVERSWAGTGLPPDVTYDTTRLPVTDRVLATDILPVRTGGVDQPIFKYYEFQDDGSLDTQTDAPLAVPLTAATARAAVRVSVDFVAVPVRTKRIDGRSTVIHGEATVASAEADDPTSGARCL
jgi:prepilin-type N-terminal cleavage/methylation domain-containing protein